MQKEAHKRGLTYFLSDAHLGSLAIKSGNQR